MATNGAAVAPTRGPAADPVAPYAATLRELPLPVPLRGPVVHGFKRGSKELGIPTANLDVAALGPQLTPELATGIYYGWASVGASPDVHKMVMSIGWNPFFGNKERTVEPHLLHVFESDFYGEELRLLVLGYLRPEAGFTTLDALVETIRADIRAADALLDAPAAAAARGDARLAPTGAVSVTPG